MKIYQLIYNKTLPFYLQYDDAKQNGLNGINK